MKRLLLVSAAAASIFAFGSGGQAQAAQFSFAYSGSGVTGSGTLTADLIAPGIWLTFAGSDTTTGGPISGTLPLLPNPNSDGAQLTSPSGFFFYDDLLLPGANPLVDSAGLLFVDGSSGEVNIFSTGPSSYLHFDNTGFNVPIEFSVTAIPEPVSLSILGVGLIGLGLLRRRNAD